MEGIRFEVETLKQKVVSSMTYMEKYTSELQQFRQENEEMKQEIVGKDELIGELELERKRLIEENQLLVNTPKGAKQINLADELADLENEEYLDDAVQNPYDRYEN